MNSPLQLSQSFVSTSLADLVPVPPPFISQYKRGEVTVRILPSLRSTDGGCGTDASLDGAEDTLSDSASWKEIMLAQLMAEAGVASLVDMYTAINVALINRRSLLDVCQIFFMLTPQMCASLQALICQIDAGTVSFTTAVKAAQQAYTTDGRLPRCVEPDRQPQFIMDDQPPQFIVNPQFIMDNQQLQFTVQDQLLSGVA